jgi:hypothetical protein
MSGERGHHKNPWMSAKDFCCYKQWVAFEKIYRSGWHCHSYNIGINDLVGIYKEGFEGITE